MAKVKLPFFCQNWVHNMPNGKATTPVKNGIQLQKKLSKRRKGGLESESASKSKAPKPLKSMK
jgi:hypothetical protein